MPCPHGIGDCSSIRHLRTKLSFSVNGATKPFHSRRPRLGMATQQPRSIFTLATTRFSGCYPYYTPWHTVYVGWRPGLLFGAVQPRNLLQIIRVRNNRSRKRHTDRPTGVEMWPNQAHFSSPIPLTLYCICKSVIGPFQHLPRIV
jgi:hypothetical protein